MTTTRWTRRDQKKTKIKSKKERASNRKSLQQIIQARANRLRRILEKEHDDIC